MKDSDQRKLIQGLAKELGDYPINEAIPYAKPVKALPPQEDDLNPGEYEYAIALLMLCLPWDRFVAMFNAMGDNPRSIHRWAAELHANKTKKV